ncbi:pseudaminic acid synthase [Alsobacter sp. R-9]
MSAFSIAGRPIGPSHPPYVIAELSGNHNGELERALRLVDAAAEAGADAVKLQTYTADTITIDHDGPGFVIAGGPWGGRKLYDLYKEAHTPWEWHPQLFARARERGLHCFSSPFDETAVHYLGTLDAPAYKIASFEIVDIPLIRAAAATGRPLIISTGMATFEEIEVALREARAAGAGGVALLHCVSGYPTPADEANCLQIPDLARRYDCPIGLSDHTLGTDVATVAVALGACIIEKHMTLARSDGGPDAEFSLEPHEMSRLVQGVRTAFSALGSATRRIKSSEAANTQFRRSLYVVRDVAAGELFTKENVRSIRPSLGLPPVYLPAVLGRKAGRDLRRGDPLQAGDVEGLSSQEAGKSS